MKKWSDKEIEVLKKSYGGVSSTILATQLDRSRAAVNLKAASLGIKFSSVQWANVRRKSDPSPLLCDSPESLYWIGFLMADGYINHDRMSVKLQLAAKDAEHLSKFGDFIGADVKNRLDRPVVTFKDPYLVRKIVERYDFSPRKTYNPPRKDILPEERTLFLALVAGLFDGDGCLSKAGMGRIQIHGTWLGFVQVLHERTASMVRGKVRHYPYLNKRGMAFWSISKRVLSMMKRELSGKVPLLERKWDRISFKSKQCHKNGEKNDNVVYK